MSTDEIITCVPPADAEAYFPKLSDEDAKLAVSVIETATLLALYESGVLMSDTEYLEAS